MYRQGGSSLKPILMALSVKSLYLFKPFAKQCKICPMERVCWEPSPVMDPILLDNISCVIDMEGISIFGLAVKTAEGLFSKGGNEIYLFNVNDLHEKKEIITGIMNGSSATIVRDPLFTKVFNTGEENVKGLIVGVSMSAVEPRASVFSGMPRISDPYMMILSEKSMKFYKINWKYWSFLGTLPSITDKKKKPTDSQNEDKINPEIQPPVDKTKEVFFLYVFINL